MNPVSGYMTLSRFDSESSRPSISVSTRSGLTHDLFRALVGPETAPGRLTEIAVVGPLRELDFPHDARTHEVRERGLRATEWRRERRRLAYERRQPAKEVLSCRG